MEATISDCLSEKIQKLRELSKKRDTAQLSKTSQGDKADTIFQANRQQMGIDCKICDNTGFILTIENDCSFAKECSCMIIYKNKLRIKKSGLAYAFQQCTFEKYTAKDSWQKDVKKKALRFLKEKRQWFYIGGAVGCGKSHICTAICAELVKNRAVYYMPWRSEIIPIKSNVNNDEAYQKLVYVLKTTDVLYIDDFFKGTVNPGDINVAFEVLNHRYVNCMTTIISSERTISEIIEKEDEAIGSRIYQMCGKSGEFCIDISRIEGRNYRLEFSK